MKQRLEALMQPKLVDFSKHGDHRGMLVALQEPENVPFTIRRVYYLLNTRTDVRRGLHAHRALRQMMIAVSGSAKILLDNGRSTTEVLLDNPYQGLILDHMIWREMFEFSDDCVLMVLADQSYDPADYIRDYDEFRRLAEQEFCK